MYEMTCRIRFSETDKTGRLSMNGLLRLFQDCGYEHALDRGFGLGYTQTTRCTWYLLSWDIESIDMPYAGEEVVLKTFIYDMQESLAKKSIAMYDMGGKCLAKGDTVWVYMNIDLQKPVLPEKDAMGWLPEDFGERLDDPAPRRRIAVPQDGMRLTPYKVNEYLLDINGHANNVRLTELAMSMVGVDDGRCRTLRAEFKGQVVAGSTIYPYIRKDYHDNNIFITVVFCDEKRITRAVFYFSSPK